MNSVEALGPSINYAQPWRYGLTPVDRVVLGQNIPVIHTAFFFEYNVSLLSDIMITLRQDIFRNGLELIPLFATKCNLCGHKHKDKVEQCENCGSKQIVTPDSAQQHFFEHVDGVSFMTRANRNNQTLQEVCEQVEFNLDVCDNGYLLAVKMYLFDEEGKVTTGIVDELLSVDPRYIDKLHDDYGKPGGQGRVCLRHRTKLLPKDAMRCREPGCTLETFDVGFKVRSGTRPESYYTNDEVCHLMKYYPSLLYGTPPIYKILENCQAYMFIEKRVKTYYEKGRPPGVFAVNTPNQKGLEEARLKFNAQMLQDPYSIPFFPVDSGQTSRASAFAAFIPFMKDPSPEMMAVKNEVRRGICSFYGVMPLFESDVAGSGGLNSESQQITAFNRTIARGQSIWNDKAYTWLMQQFGITDFALRLKKAERQDEVQEANLQLLKDQHALNMVQLGFSVEMDGNDFRFVKNTLNDAIRQNPILNRPVPGEENLPTEEEQQAFQGQSKVDPWPTYTGELDADTVVYCDSITNKGYIRPRLEQLFKAIMSVDLPERFQKLSPQEADILEHQIIKAMMDPDGWSVDRIIRLVKKFFPEVEEWELRRIIRTETARIANKAHELEAVERDPPNARYIWAGPHDHRTSKVCRRIKQEQPAGGLPLQELKAFIHDIANGEGSPYIGEWVLHQNERHTFRRVFDYGGAQ